MTENLNSEKETDRLPLVSIIIVTYNSQKYVIETLESAKAQTYQNIELIVSDDCSNDNTVELCRQWIEKNKHRFIRAQLLTSKNNTGITPNCNRGIKTSSGLWVKYFAGDDILLPNCISDYMQYIQNTSDCNVLFGRIKTLKNGTISEVKDEKRTFSLTRKKLYKRLLKFPVIYAPAAFYSRFALDSVGGFNEAYPVIEDRLMYFVLLEKGYRFHYINSFVTIYRIHDSNISGVSYEIKGKKWLNKNYYNCWKKMLLNEILPRQFKKMLFIDALYTLSLLIYK